MAQNIGISAISSVTECISVTNIWDDNGEEIGCKIILKVRKSCISDLLLILADVLYLLSVIGISAKFRIGASLLIYCVDIVFLAMHALVYILQVLEQAERLAVVLQCNSVSSYLVDVHVCVLCNVEICSISILCCAFSESRNCTKKPKR